MATQIAQALTPAMDKATGISIPLRTSLASPDLKKHRAMVAVELEAMAKTYDRFGWERDRGTPVQDRMFEVWMNALQDYPIDEIRTATEKAIVASPKKMPTVGHVVAEIKKARKAHVKGAETATNIAAENIKSGRAFRCTNISPALARECVRRGLVTEKQCKEVNVRL